MTTATRNTDSRSPSPPPTAPVQATPGPRAVRLHQIYSSALRATLSANSYANFSACFPTPAQYCPSALEGVWKQLNSRLEAECTKDFEKICEERNIVAGLNGLDDVIELAKSRKARAVDGEHPPRAVNVLSGEELYEARLAPWLTGVDKDLKQQLEQTQTRNEEKMKEVMKQRQEIERLVGRLEGLVKDVEGAAGIMEQSFASGGDVGDLRAQIWEMDKEMTTVNT